MIRSKWSATGVFRVLILVAVWALMTYLAFAHQQAGGGPEGVPTVHALCPFGGMATLYKTLADGSFVRRTQASAVILLGGTLLLALVFRRAFCGWICPLGAMQELFAAIGRKLGWRRDLGANPIDANLRWLKYLILVVILVFTYATAELVFAPYDPWAAYAHLSAGWGEISEEFLVGFVVLVVAVLGSVVVQQPFCRYLCPFGGLLGLISRIGVTRVVRDTDTCVHCHACDKACPVDIRVEAMPQVLTGECTMCGKCVDACPVPATLQLKAPRRPISRLAMGIAAIAIFFGVVFATKAAGIWQSRPSDMEEITHYGGALDPANIRGFMSMDEIAQSYGVSASDLIARVELPADTDRSTAVKDIMKPLDREVEEIREAVAEMTGVPSPAVGEAGAPSGAAQSGDQPAIKGTMTLEEICEAAGVSAGDLPAALELPEDTPLDKPVKDIMKPLGREVGEIRQVVEDLRETPASEKANAPENAETAPDTASIKGTMTFGDIEAQFGVDPAELLTALELPSDAALNVPVRDILKPAGRDVSELREAVGKLVAK